MLGIANNYMCSNQTMLAITDNFYNSDIGYQWFIYKLRQLSSYKTLKRFYNKRYIKCVVGFSPTYSPAWSGLCYSASLRTSYIFKRYSPLKPNIILDAMFFKHLLHPLHRYAIKSYWTTHNFLLTLH
jgi:hypothetical protein